MVNHELSGKVARRTKELISNNSLTMACELQIFEAIAAKYQFKTITHYAKANNLSYNGVKHQLKEGKLQHITIAGITLCF